MTTKTTDWKQTYTGKKFYPLEPDAELICIDDIARALSMICRYGGHVGRFYSVAEHSFILSQEFFSGWHYRLVALLHDAAEAYLGDLVRPLKHLPQFTFYRDAEDRLLKMILDKFCRFDWRLPLHDVKQKDSLLLAQEAQIPMLVPGGCDDWDLVDTYGFTPTIKFRSPEESERLYLNEFHRLKQIQSEKMETRTNVFEKQEVTWR